MQFLIALMLSFGTMNASAAKTHQVEILPPMKFVPALINVKVGDKVVWTNKTTMLHNVVSPSAKMRSKFLKKGESFEFTFTQAGLVDYYCEPHRAHMKGKVQVEK